MLCGGTLRVCALRSDVIYEYKLLHEVSTKLRQDRPPKTTRTHGRMHTQTHTQRHTSIHIPLQVNGMIHTHVNVALSSLSP